VLGATTTLVLGLVIQTLMLTAYLALADRPTLFAIFRAWRPSLFAGFMGVRLADVVPPSRSGRPRRCARWRWSRSCPRRCSPATCSSRSMASCEMAGIALIVVGVVLL
jgi:hypothetical protein